MMNDSWEHLDSFVDFVFDKLANYGYDDLKQPEKVVICVWSLKGEIDNGGFEQWFFNESGDWAIDTPESLRLINAPLAAAMVENSIAIFPKGPPPQNTDERREFLESASDDTNKKWHQLSEQFYKEEEDLESLLLAYAKKNIKTSKNDI